LLSSLPPSSTLCCHSWFSSFFRLIFSFILDILFLSRLFTKCLPFSPSQFMRSGFLPVPWLPQSPMLLLR
jgi:hypothetical protein